MSETERFMGYANKLMQRLVALDIMFVGRWVLAALSVSVVHFLGYMYFATGGFPVFLEPGAYASLTFNLAAYYAFASVGGRALAFFSGHATSAQWFC